MKILVKTAFGLENILAKEIEELGGKKIEILKRGVFCEGGDELMYRINYESRTALRVLKFLAEFEARNENELYRGVSGIDWDEIFDSTDTFAIDSIVHSEYFTHSKYVALKSKDAIVDQFRKKYNHRPSVDITAPNFRIMVHIRESTCGLFLDSSGYSLHKRGYRFRSTEAPISECLAAGMLKLAGWDGNGTFLDPMCGSGTFLVEAAMMALNIPAGKYRTAYAFQQWKDYKAELFQKIKKQANDNILREKEGLRILGSDKSRVVIQSTQENIRQAGLENVITLEPKPIQRLKNELSEGLIVTNPPYDKRLKDDDIEALYASLGDVFKKQFTGWTAWLISSNIAALKKVGLSTSKKLTLYNGADECKFLRYDMYAGSKKQKKQ